MNSRKWTLHKFWYVNWSNESPLFHNIDTNMEIFINKHGQKVVIFFLPRNIGT